MSNVIRIYIGDWGDVTSGKKPFSKTNLGKKLLVVNQYLRMLDSNMKTDVRNKHYEVASFSFQKNLISPISQLYSSVKNHLEENGITSEEIGRYDDYQYESARFLPISNAITKSGTMIELLGEPKSKLFSNKNALNVLQNIDEIYEFAKSAVKPKDIPNHLLGGPDALLDKDGCVAPSFAQDQIYPLLDGKIRKLRGQERNPSNPMTWNQFIDKYVREPKPSYKRVADDLDSNPYANEVFLSPQQYRQQKGFFDKITRKGATEGYQLVGNQVEREKNSFLNAGDNFFSKENIEEISDRIQSTVDTKLKHHRLWSDILNKVCPSTIMGKVMECTLPPLECRELIKEIGIKNILPMLVQFESFDPRLRKIRKKWESKREKQNIKAVRFTRRSHMFANTTPGGMHENLNEFSVSMWVRAKSDANKNGTHIFSHYSTKSEDNRAFAIKVGKDRNIRATFHGDGTYEDRKEIVSSQRVFDSDWHHVLVTYDGPKDKIRIFINGKEDLDAEVKGRGNFTTIFNSSAPLSVASTGDGTKIYNGFLDEIVIYKKSLNKSHAKELSDPKMLIRNSRLSTLAVHWWRMGDDPRDVISKSTNDSTRINRIFDQIGETNLTPKRFRQADSGIYDAHPFDDGMLDELLKIIEEFVDVEIFCQILLMWVVKAFGFDIPNFGGPGGIPKIKTNNPFGDLLSLLEQASIQVVVDVVMSSLLGMLESLSVDCNDINKILQGDFEGTTQAKFGENFGDLIKRIATGDLNEIGKNPLGQKFADVVKQSEDFLSETGQMLEDIIKNSTVTKYKDPATGEDRDFSSVLEGFNITTPNEVGQQFDSPTGWMEDEKKSEEPSQQQSAREQIFCNPTKDLGTIFRDASSLLSPDELLRLLSGTASDQSLDVISKTIVTRYPHLSFLSSDRNTINEVFGIFGTFTGLSTLRDRVLAAADEMEDTYRDSSYCPISPEDDFFSRKDALEKITNGQLTDEEMNKIVADALEAKNKRFKNLVDSILPKSDDLDSSKCEKTIYDNVPEPEILEEALSRTVYSTMSSIVSAYDTDMLLYKPSISEQRMGTRKVPKILWQDDEVEVTTVDDGTINYQTGKLKDTIINPEFKAMVTSGHIPTRKDGSPDGTEFGAILKTKWWPPWEEGWLKKTERIPLGKGEDGESLAKLAGKDEPTVDDLPGSIGPYTDYDEDKGGSRYASKDVQKVEVAANVKRHLKPKNVQENYFSGRSQYTFKARNLDSASEKSLKNLNKTKRMLKKTRDKRDELEKMLNKSTTFFGFSFNDPGGKIKENKSKLDKRVKKLEEEISKKEEKYLNKVSKTSVEDRLYADKAYYGLDGITESSVISKTAATKGYEDPAPKLPTFNVIYANQFGTEIENETSFSVRRFGKSPINLHVVRSNEVDSNLKAMILKTGYDPSPCDTADPSSGIRNNYTSQENLFAHIVSQKWQKYYGWSEQDELVDLINSELKDSVDDGNDTDDMMESVYDDIVRKTIIMLAQEVSNTPLLSKVEGTKNSMNDESSIGIEFIEVNPTQSRPHKELGLDPRIMDFLSFVNEVKESYNFFKDCKIGEVNLDGKRAYKTPLSLALRSVHSNMIARLYSVEYILQAIFPMVEFDTELTSLTEELLLQKIRNDMTRRPGYYDEFRKNCIDMHNLKSEYGMIDEDMADTFEDAFRPTLQKEFAFALEKVKQVVLKECSEAEDKDEDDDSITRGLALKNILLDNVDMIDVKEDRFSSLSPGLNKSQRRSIRRTKRAIRKAERYINDTDKVVTKITSTDISRADSETSKDVSEKRILSEKRKEFKNRQKIRKEKLKNNLVKKEEKFRDKNRIDFWAKGQIYLERYIKDSNGKMITRIKDKDIDLDSVNHLLDTGVKKYGLRLVYVEMPEKTKKTPQGQDVDVSRLMNLDSPVNDEYLYSVKDRDYLDGFKTGNFESNKIDGEYGSAKIPVVRDGKRVRNSKGELQFRNRKLNDVKAKRRERTLFVHPIADFSIDSDELLNLLDIDRDMKSSDKCFENEGFTGPGLTDDKTSLDHYHEYFVDENGNGYTTTTFSVENPDRVVGEHEHEIKNFKILGEQSVLGQEETNHAHGILQGTEREDMEKNLVSRKIFEHLMLELRDTDDFTVMYDYCFDLQKISTVVSSYAYLANSTRDLIRMFDVTKRRMENYLFNAQQGSNYYNSAISCNQNNLAKSIYNMGNTNLDDLWNPSILLMILMTPLHIYKGWSKTADPHCLISQTIVDLGNAGFLIPELQTHKIEIPFTDPVECSEVQLPTLPGTKIAFPGFTQLVALGVTYAPLLVGMPPFPPTPFGLIYYLVVDPLLMLMSPWMIPLAMNDPNFKNALRSAGLDLDKEVPVCLPGEVTPLAENEDKETEDEEEGCKPLGPDPIDVGGYGKSNC